MPQKPIPLTNQQRSSQEELGGGSAIAMNVVRDATDTLVRRPGLAFTTVATESQINSGGIDCIHATYGGVLYATGASLGIHDLYKITAGGYTTISQNLNQRLLGTARPQVAETGALLVFAAGEAPQKIVLATNISSRLGGSPPDATHVIANSLRLLINDPKTDTSQVRYSSIATGTVYTGHEVWTLSGLSGSATAEARPDPVVALGENTNTVFVFGRSTLQLFSPDPTWTFAPAQTINLGCSAPYSIVRVDENFAWLDDKRRFVISDGLSYQPMSTDIDGDLKNLTSVTDCFGYRVYEPPVDCMVWTFPTDGLTFVKQTNGGWSQWAKRSASTGMWEPLGVNCHTFLMQSGKNIVGTTDGYVVELSRSVETDFDVPIEAYVESGFVSRVTTERKHCKRIQILLKRGTNSASTTTAQRLRISYADEPGEWCDPLWVDLGTSIDQHPVVELNSLGVYRTRNWRFDFSTADEMAIVGIIEDYDTLGV
jgi:hypothetical protein